MKSTLGSTESIRPHDLIRIGSANCLLGFEMAHPWVSDSISVAPYVVVRRSLTNSCSIPVGVRGSSREQRWASFISKMHIVELISPVSLRVTNEVSRKRIAEVPALGLLLKLQKELASLNLRWGPGGSVGFELASGYPTASSSSDLDLLIFAEQEFDQKFAKSLLQTCSSLELSSVCAMDILVETPGGAFSLKELVNSKNGEVLLRYAGGSALVKNPWLPRMELEAGRK